MQNLVALWTSLDARRRLLAMAATAGVFLAVLALGRMAASPTMALLYAGLEPAAAGEVVRALDQRGLRYEVRGDAIHVEARARDEIRMTLAAVGLPQNSAGGYELLDGLTGFGTTSQMFDAAYWRAKEGELARTISASPHVRNARVHIAPVAGGGLRRDGRASASVTVTPAGAILTPVQALGIRFLVASAVPGLTPEDVAVIDAQGGGLITENAASAGGADRVADLRRSVERMLEATVGPGRAVVEISLETVTERETISERRIDPDSRIVVTQETEERSQNSTETRAGTVGVASNLPEGDAGPDGGRAEARETQTRARTGYDVSATQREIERLPGAIRRLTVAVMIDGTRAPGPDGTAIWTPRPEAELDALRALVEAAVGFDAARGDVITVRSMPLEPMVTGLGSGPGTDWMTRLGLDAMGLARLGMLGLVALVLGLFVLRPLLAGRPASAPAVPGRRSLPMTADRVLTGEIDTPAQPMRGEGDEGLHGDAPPTLKEDPVDRLRALISARQAESVAILGAWIDEPAREDSVRNGGAR